MKQLTEKKSVTAANGWGHDSTCDHQIFELEESDVGRVLEHYLGHNHRSLCITRKDVGRHILIQSSPGWSCWSFQT